MIERRDLLQSVGRRNTQDFEWNLRRLESAAANQALRDGFYEGHVFRRQATASRVLRKYFEAQGAPSSLVEAADRRI